MSDKKQILIGTDEAGYGPNLGPLVITATSWSGTHVLPADELWEKFSDVLAQYPDRKDTRLHVADSKEVYSPATGIARLERSVLAFFQAMEIKCSTLRELGEAVSGPQFSNDYATVCGDVVPEISLPLVADVAEIGQQSQALQAAFDKTGLRPTQAQSCIMFAPAFNQKVTAVGSKGILLSTQTLQLIKSAVDNWPDEFPSGLVVCDKHGGRNRYDDFISQTFDDSFVFRHEESRARSVYQLKDLQFCFRTKAEEVLPVALASMISKYVRELVMHQFNRFWQHYLADLKPTKGYPMDAKRFWEQISTKADELKISKASVWRCR